ncbi:ALK tyrosine kinase receptor-like isoform X1 [Stegostoma tigrinum]|uniref:ALK tyrosine kinase receptor-like isoform X1 n=2 Tax=Stegostoma tigrinum TaxID=3053191 RepID=UPI00202B2E1B|nr:ALK tyrosine kinase receptor-like isoform X1 [Stegostoma tigrinum]
MKSGGSVLFLLLLLGALPPSSPERQQQQRRGGTGGSGRVAESRPQKKAARAEQTYTSRLKRKGLAVDFTFSPLFRNYLLEFFGRAADADCRLLLDCEALASALEGTAAHRDGIGISARSGFEETGSSAAASPQPAKRRLKKQHQPNQVVLEVGASGDTARCRPQTPQRQPAAPLLYNLTRVFLAWSSSSEGRLRIRLIPERRARESYPQREEIISAAIRTSEPRVRLHVSFAVTGVPQSEGNGWIVNNSPAAWNFTWLLKDDTPLSTYQRPHDFYCDFETECELEYSSDGEDGLTASVIATPEDLSFVTDIDVPDQDYSEKSSDGHFLFLNASQYTSFLLLSPWLTSISERCTLEMAIYLQDSRSGEYVVQLLHNNESKTVLMSSESEARTGWTVLQGRVGCLEESFRISLEYKRNNGRIWELAAVDSIILKNCNEGPLTGSRTTLEGSFTCQNGASIKLRQLCDFNNDCSNAEDEGTVCNNLPTGSYCSFEEEECGWSSVTSEVDEPSWKLKQSRSVNEEEKNNLCYSEDHALFLNTKETLIADFNELRSPIFPTPIRNSACEVRMSLCLYGTLVGNLSFLVVENKTDEEYIRTLWEFANITGSGSWQKATLKLPDVSDRFWLQLNTVWTDESTAIIALDNVTLSLDCYLSSNVDSSPINQSANTNQSLLGRAFVDKTVTAASKKVQEETEVNALSGPWIIRTCGASGPKGPTQTQCNNAYKNTSTSVVVVAKGSWKGIQKWRVPSTDTYKISAYGAAGGIGGKGNFRRFHGVLVQAIFQLEKDLILYILVGQQGEDACPNINPTIQSVCLGENNVIEEELKANGNVTEWAGGGGGGGGATFIFKMDNGEPIPLLIAAGGGGKAYLSKDSGFPEEMLETDSSVPGVNGRSGAAGGGGGWSDVTIPPWSGKSLTEGAEGGQSCPQAIKKWGWITHGGFGGGGGACTAGGGGGGYIGGNATENNRPEKDGGCGVSYISPLGEIYTPPLAVTESHGEVEIVLHLNCSHCEHNDCVFDHIKEELICLCESGKILASDSVTCILPPEGHLPLSLVLSVVLSVVIAASLLAFSGIMIVYRLKHQELQAMQMELQSPDYKLSKLRTSTIMTDYNPNYCFAGKTTSISDLKEVSRKNIVLIRGLGHGAFGEVYEGQVTGVPGEPSPLQVAVKTLPEVCSEQDELDFLMEALIISKFCHQNIVRCIGVSLQALPRFILLELMAGGDMKSFLREYRPKPGQPSTLNMLDLLNVARDIARGCQYLEENHFIHRDIAARNCLLTFKGTGRVAKIGDFGMARDIYRASYYRKGGRAMLPVKWMPPEAFMEGIFTSKTDTWSFGVLLWEIFSLGYMPYPSKSNQEVLEFVTSGGRMDPPKNCPGPVYRIMTQCWQHQPEDRPNFATILERIDYCTQDPDVINTSLPVEYGPPAEEEGNVPVRPDDPDGLAPLLVSPAQEAESQGASTDLALPPQRPTSLCLGEHRVKFVPNDSAVVHTGRPAEDGSHVNKTYSQMNNSSASQQGRGSRKKPTNLWNPTYGSWFTEKPVVQNNNTLTDNNRPPEREDSGFHASGGTSTAIPNSRPQASAVVLEPSSLVASTLDVPLFRLQHFPCGNVSYALQQQQQQQQQGLSLEATSACATFKEDYNSHVNKGLPAQQDPRVHPVANIPTWDSGLSLAEDVNVTIL